MTPADDSRSGARAAAPARPRTRPRPRRSLARGTLLTAAIAVGVAAAHLAAGSPSPGPAGNPPALLPVSLRMSERLEGGARQTLLETYAPVVLLAPGERTLPVHVEWYLVRSRLERSPAGGVVKAALGAVRVPRLRPSPAARGGSEDPQDWTVYGHAYRATDGGMLLQYWFLYAYNAFHGFGDHEADWEHVTVRLSPEGEPLGAWYSQHDANAPGDWRSWAQLSREGAHPVVLSALGSHASYARRRDVRWFDESCPTTRPDRAAALDCRVWRTWSGETGGVVDLGSRANPAVPYLLWPGRWGADGGIGDSEGGPPGPAFQPGWCSGGTPSCS